jgi:serine/threonine protein kinase
VPAPLEAGSSKRFSRTGSSGAESLVRDSESLVLGRYRLLERLGAGGFGVVWRAHDELLHREVAVKRISLAPEEDSERASREALAAARLSHPAIVALYEACAVQDAFYLISELVHGETLAQLIAARSLAEEEVLEIGVAIAGALSHAHARGVIHRDVKPQNVLVPHRLAGPAGEPQAPPAKLTDFGGARLAGEDALTRTGETLGTLAYMAPEQSEGHEAGEAADLYSLALVLYEALCGVNPVRGPTPAATARRIGRPLPPLERRRGDLPRGLTRALDEALAPSPADRGTLEELRLALEEALERGLGRPRRRDRRRRAPVEAEDEPEDRAVPAWQAAPLRQAVPRPQLIPERQRHSPPTRESSPVQDEELATAPPRRLALPRTVWLACALAVSVWQAWVGRPGVALLALAAVAPLVVLPSGRRSRANSSKGWVVEPAWLACALAPVLGLAGLAGAFPTVAGQAMRSSERAALGALGYWWLTLAEPLTGRHLWLGPSPGTPARAVWEGSLSSSAVHVIGPMLSLGVLLGATLWAVGSVLLPWIVRGRSAALDVVAATTWSAAIATTAPMLDSGLSAHAAHLSPHGAVLGAIFGGVLAVAARALRGPV